jgi:NAD(P)-dependent dehydrogenase (short-subunit alcohol dehydrogenase family)
LKEPADVSKSGIGNEIAQCFVREGAKVVIANLNKEAAESAARNSPPRKKREAL